MDKIYFFLIVCILCVLFLVPFVWNFVHPLAGLALLALIAWGSVKLFSGW